MKYYCKKVPFELAKKLPKMCVSTYYTNNGELVSAEYRGNEYMDEFDEDDVPSYPAPTYAEVIDWLLDKGLSVEIKCRCPIELRRKSCWYGSVYGLSNAKMLYGADNDELDWCDACDRAIDFALTRIN